MSQKNNFEYYGGEGNMVMKDRGWGDVAGTR